MWYQELLGYLRRDLRRRSSSLMCGYLCSKLLDLLLECPVSLYHSLYTARSTTLLQLPDLLLQIGNMLLGSLSDISLGLSVVRSFSCQLGLTQVSNGSLSATGTSTEASGCIRVIWGKREGVTTNLFSWALPPPLRPGCSNFDYSTLV